VIRDKDADPMNPATSIDPEQITDIVYAACLICMIAAFFITLLINRRRGSANVIEDLWIRATAALTVPIGILFLLCAFKPAFINVLPKIGSARFYLGVAGLVIIYMSFRAIFSQRR
jgi:hypothetical protein